MDFADLYARYAQDVFRFAYFLSGNRELAEDIAAETFSRALVAGDSIRPGTVKGYLLAVAPTCSWTGCADRAAPPPSATSISMRPTRLPIPKPSPPAASNWRPHMRPCSSCLNRSVRLW